MIPNKKSGFTLIEMVVTIAILALLAGIATPLVTRQVEKGRIARAQADCDAIVKAIVMYHMEYGRYPGGSQSDPTYNYQGPGGSGFNALAPELINGSVKFLNKKIGLDPWGNNYCYHIYTRSNPYQDVSVFSMGPNGSSQSWSGSLWNTGSFGGDDIGSLHDN
ncbi:MAG: type II secretion system protein GspG [Planctomycetota bacterium]|nr:type II secretion system protein GspG [Planctomycetota bacterium]